MNGKNLRVSWVVFFSVIIPFMAIELSHADCSYLLSPATKSFAQKGGTGKFKVKLSEKGCSWTAQADVEWIKITSPQKELSKNATVKYKVSPNPAPTVRQGTVTVAGQTHTVVQDGIPCLITIPQATATFPSEGGAGSFLVQIPEGCNWVASPPYTEAGEWLTITNEGPGSGNGIVTFLVSKNITDSEREDRITVRSQGGQTTYYGSMVINQEGLDWNTPIKWKLSVLDPGIGKPGGAGRATSIALDSNGNPHIVYYSDSEDAVKYATQVNGKWKYTKIDNNIRCLPGTSIAVDRNNVVHVSYSKKVGDILTPDPDYDLYYANNTGGKWSIIPVDVKESVGGYNSIAVDTNGKVHIAYNDNTNQAVKYATSKNGYWEMETVDTVFVIETKLALDLNGKAHISYMPYSTKDLKYATNVSGHWESNIIDPKSGWDNDIAVDSQNRVHISHFTEEPDFALKYTTNSSGQWVTEIIEKEIDWFTSIAIDAKDKVHIACFDNWRWQLKYVSNIDGEWKVSIVDKSMAYDVGRYNDLAIDKDGKIHISYFIWDFDYIGPIGKLKYATTKK